MDGWPLHRSHSYRKSLSRRTLRSLRIPPELAITNFLSFIIDDNNLTTNKRTLANMTIILFQYVYLLPPCPQYNAFKIAFLCQAKKLQGFNFNAHFLNKDLTNPINKRLILAFAHDAHWSVRAVAIGPLTRSASSKQEAATAGTDRCLPWSVYEYGFNVCSRANVWWLCRDESTSAPALRAWYRVLVFYVLMWNGDSLLLYNTTKALTKQ